MSFRAYTGVVHLSDDPLRQCAQQAAHQVQAKTIRQNHIAEIKKELADLNRFRVSHQGQAESLDSRLPDVSE